MSTGLLKRCLACEADRSGTRSVRRLRGRGEETWASKAARSVGARVRKQQTSRHRALTQTGSHHNTPLLTIGLASEARSTKRRHPLLVLGVFRLTNRFIIVGRIKFGPISTPGSFFQGNIHLA
jgi:hypothetical protein